MTKKLLPTMIGVALAGGMAAAQADVTVFGHIDTSVVASDNYTTAGQSENSFVCTTCSIGFKGSEDLGNGLKAIFSIDFQYDTTKRNTGKASSKSVEVTTATPGGGTTTVDIVTSVSDTSSITDRDQWLGLAGSFGQVRVGTISTSYKSHGAMLDPAYRTVIQQRDWGLQSVLHTGAGEKGQGRATNTVRYDTPDWNGLQGTAHYTLNSDERGQSFNAWGAGAQYSNGGLLVFADYITANASDDVTNNGDDDAYKVGAKYTLGNFAVFGQYEVDGGLISAGNTLYGYLRGSGIASIGDGADLWMLGGTYTMGNNTLYGAYSSSDDADDARLANGASVDTGYDAWEVGAIHSMSKQTLVYLGYGDISYNENNADDSTGFALGMKHKF
jgi:predicted porin